MYKKKFLRTIGMGKFVLALTLGVCSSYVGESNAVILKRHDGANWPAQPTGQSYQAGVAVFLGGRLASFWGQFYTFNHTTPTAGIDWQWLKNNPTEYAAFKSWCVAGDNRTYTPYLQMPSTGGAVTWWGQLMTAATIIPWIITDETCTMTSVQPLALKSRVGVSPIRDTQLLEWNPADKITEGGRPGCMAFLRGCCGSTLKLSWDE